MSAGIAVPRRIFSHGFLFNRGEKMSKSVGNVIDPFALSECLRGRPAALFPAARGAVRAGRQLQPRGDRGAHQCRPRERPRQPGAALAVHGGAQLRRHAAGAGCVHRRRPGDPRVRRRHDRQGARRHGDPAAAPDPPARLVGGRRGQPLFRRRSAVELRHRPAAHGHDPLRHRRGDPAGRHPGAAVHLRVGGKLLDQLGVRPKPARFAKLGGTERIAPAPSRRRRRRSSRATSSPASAAS